MPLISIKKTILYERLGLDPKKFTQEQFEDLCFDFGVELDEVTSEAEMYLKMTGKADETASKEEIYKIDIPANRYDLVCAEGIIQSLLVFLGKQEYPNYKVNKVEKPLQFKVNKNLDGYRPILVVAVLRNITFTPERYASFIDLQEKLHENICRRRTLASVGTHDLDTIEGPFTYDAVNPDDIEFAPLDHATPVKGRDLHAHFAENRPTIVKFLHLLRDNAYPLIRDAKGRVLSLPPIINSDHSKISLNTKNVLIEVTATDQTKAEIVLNTIVCFFSQYCDPQYEVEAVDVTNSDGTKSTWPNLSTRVMEASAKWINECVGINLSAEEMAVILKRMSLTSKADGDRLITDVPVTRSDILHACDIMEDVAIAHGYDKIKQTTPHFYTVGRMQPLNKLSDLVRGELAQAGYMEILSLGLCSRLENFDHLRRKDDGSAVSVTNPATIEFQIARTTLLPGMLKTMHHNKSAPKPLRLFEVSDVVLLSDETDVGAKNSRRVCALYCTGQGSGFEQLHGLLDRLMQVLDVLPTDEKKARQAAYKAAKKRGEKVTPVTNATYALLNSDDAPYLFEGHGAKVMLYPHDGQPLLLGYAGMLHPEVIGNFELGYPCSVFEIDLEPFV